MSERDRDIQESRATRAWQYARFGVEEDMPKLNWTYANGPLNMKNQHEWGGRMVGLQGSDTMWSVGKLAENGFASEGNQSHIKKVIAHNGQEVPVKPVQIPIDRNIGEFVTVFVPKGEVIFFRSEDVQK